MKYTSCVNFPHTGLILTTLEEETVLGRQFQRPETHQTKSLKIPLLCTVFPEITPLVPFAHTSVNHFKLCTTDSYLLFAFTLCQKIGKYRNIENSINVAESKLTLLTA